MSDRNRSEQLEGNETEIIRKLTDKCFVLLEEVYRLTSVIDSAAKGENFSEVESLFVKRGEEIQKLTDCENNLTSFLEQTEDDFDKTLIQNYSDKRIELFRKIQTVDSEIDKLIRKLRDEILVEMKELYKGRKMQKRYLNTNSAQAGFIDIKE
ncbi:hypothetical protein ACFL6G_04195 [candidate division KSB1 bacterium]